MQQKETDKSARPETEEKRPKGSRLGIHVVLFLITLLTTTLAGSEWQFSRFLGSEQLPLTWEYFLRGFSFSLPFLGILTVHEFGHYFTAKQHRVRVSLPYYLPLWFGWLGAPSIGTMGAFIRIREAIDSRKKYFDIGIAGPLAGFVVALGVLFYGFTHLPPPEYIYQVHPEYEAYGPNYADQVYQSSEETGNFQLGTPLLYKFFERYVAPDPARVPNTYEIIHYPWLFAGFLSLLFTALNLIPIGQLDGGHILYGLIGNRLHRIVSGLLFIVFITYAGLGMVEPSMDTETLQWAIPLYLLFLLTVFGRLTPSFQGNLMIALVVFSVQYVASWLLGPVQGYSGWLVFGFLIGRVLGVYHPPVPHDEPLSRGRQVLGWLALVIFVISFSPAPFVFE